MSFIFLYTETDLSPDKDGGILKRNLKQGERVATPNDGSIVTGIYWLSRISH